MIVQLQIKRDVDEITTLYNCFHEVAVVKLELHLTSQTVCSVGPVVIEYDLQ